MLPKMKVEFSRADSDSGYQNLAAEKPVQNLAAEKPVQNIAAEKPVPLIVKKDTPSMEYFETNFK